MRFSHILVANKYEAEDLERRMAAGEAFAELAKKYSNCGSAKRGGDLGEIPLSRFVEAFAKAAEKLRVGEVSPVVKTQFGYHLILRLQ